MIKSLDKVVNPPKLILFTLSSVAPKPMTSNMIKTHRKVKISLKKGPISSLVNARLYCLRYYKVSPELF